MQGPRGGLARYRSAPATWLETLLESEEEQPPQAQQHQQQSDVGFELPKPPPSPPPPSAADEEDDGDIDLELLGVGGGGLSNFLRQNSSPAEFLSLINSGGGFEGYFGYSSSYGYGSPSGKRAREAEDLDKVSPTTTASSSGAVKALEKTGDSPSGLGPSMDTEMEKLLEDSVLCRVRAKRGCATHPRSIAERVRRTRISDRIRKLQELVPNMDKQTNTADMLDEAVAYVKFLQQQIQELSEQQKKCKCSSHNL